jgi:hypothetical protein
MPSLKVKLLFAKCNEPFGSMRIRAGKKIKLDMFNSVVVMYNSITIKGWATPAT